MIHYIIQIISAQILFLLTYELLLKNQTFFSTNRFYLIGTYILSFFLPFFHLSQLNQQIPTNLSIQLPPILLGTPEIAGPQLLEAVVITENIKLIPPDLTHLILFAWVIVALIIFSQLCYKLYSLHRLKVKYISRHWQGVRIVTIPQSKEAFSFGNSIYIGDQLKSEVMENILLHEHQHITGRHFIDLIILECSKIIFWFNPLTFRYQKLIKETHEYIADAKVVMGISKKDYFQSLLSYSFQTDQISFVNSFFNHSLIKNRIAMLQKQKSRKASLLRYTAIIPLLGLMLLYVACTQESTAQSSLITEESIIVQKVEEIKEEMAKTGEITENDEKALKGLLLLITEDGFSNPMFDDVIADAKIPFGVIDKVPVYPGCENLTNVETKDCFVQKITELVGKEFNTKIAKENKLTGRQKAYAHFTIDINGEVTNVKIESGSDAVKEEAKRVVQKLPKMQAGEQEGKKVNVEYTLPIIFEVE